MMEVLYSLMLENAGTGWKGGMEVGRVLDLVSQAHKCQSQANPPLTSGGLKLLREEFLISSV